MVHLNRRALRVLDSLNDRGAGSYRTERVLLCDQCVDLLDQYRLITLPPVPEAHPGLPPDGASVTVATPSAPTSPSPADTPSIGR
ncbi:MAG: hypothetical protein NZ518_04445 [Dehalococcoidia bacterium]|nr:hypothetical protein [Dehalococcoidia bacterium]